MKTMAAGRPGVLEGGVNRFVFVVAALALSSCATIPPYDSTSYKNATDLKAESMILIDKSGDSPAAHKQEIDGLRLRLRQALEYERGKGDLNRVTVKQWETLNDPGKGLIGEYLKAWEEEGRGQGEVYRKESAKNVDEAFNQIIELERHKVRQ